MTDKRNERMLEEVLKLPGNETCADCHASGPRWASVNLGIVLCVTCASVHRKLGTHKSRVKSITLDTWTRDQITSLRTIGNTASNAIYNPNEALHPPPILTGAEERDSELEKYIRRKYEQGAFRASSSSTNKMPAPTSLNRARERDGKLAYLDPQAGARANGDGMRSRSESDAYGGTGGGGGGRGGLDTNSSPWAVEKENKRNPELNDVVVRKPTPVQIPTGASKPLVTSPQDRDLPPLPGQSRVRPRGVSGIGSGSKVGTGGSEATLIDLAETGGSQTGWQVNGNGNGVAVSLGAQTASQSFQPSPTMAYPSQTSSFAGQPAMNASNQYNPFLSQQFMQQQQQQQQQYGYTPQQSTNSYGISPSASNSFAPSNPFFQGQGQAYGQAQGQSPFPQQTLSSTYGNHLQPIQTNSNGFLSQGGVSPGTGAVFGTSPLMPQGMGGAGGYGMPFPQQVQQVQQPWGGHVGMGMNTGMTGIVGMAGMGMSFGSGR